MLGMNRQTTLVRDRKPPFIRTRDTTQIVTIPPASSFLVPDGKRLSYLGSEEVCRSQLVPGPKPMTANSSETTENVEMVVDRWCGIT
jgi:hypothetical protein